MRRILYAGIEAMAAAVILLPVFLAMNRILFRDWKKMGLYCVFSFYLAAVYALVGLPNIAFCSFELTVNLLPFVGMPADLKNSVLNIALFVPLGFFLPVLWDKYASKRRTMLFGLGMTLFIELLQIFTFRTTDINDIITNVFGTFLGWLSANILLRKCPAVSGIIKEKNDRELYVLCAVVFGVMFLVQPFVSSFIWDVFVY